MIWIIGIRGVLGSELARLFKREGIPFLGTDSEIDIRQLPILESFIENHLKSGQHPFSFMINCAAYTAVDKAEQEQELAFAINADGAKNLALMAKKISCPLIHLSTDYVFDGMRPFPEGYREEDQVHPLNIYGKSKALGEKHIQENYNNFYIIRTSWLYGTHGPSFVHTMLKLFKERDMVKVVSNQTGSPTYTKDLADFIFYIIGHCQFQGKVLIPYGIYHFSGEGACSWFEFACAIRDKAQEEGIIPKDKNIDLIPILDQDWPIKTPRPLNSLLSKEKIRKNLDFHPPRWENSLQLFIKSAF